MKIKKWLTPSNIIFLGVLVFFLIKQYPARRSNFQKEGTFLKAQKVSLIGQDGLAIFPPKDGRAIGIFWSTTCAPCKLEMKRLKISVEEGNLPGELIFAINPYESKSTIKKFLKKNPYPFTFISDNGIANRLNVQGTPTTIFIKGGEVTSMKTGISITGIWSAESFLSE